MFAMRYILAALALAVLTSFLLPVQEAQARRERSKFCTYQTLENKKWATVEVKKTESCFAKKFGINPTKFRDIARRESGHNPYAYNRSGCGGWGCLGLFQHHQLYWYDRLRIFNDKLRHFNIHTRNWWQPRVNSLVSAVYMKRYGMSAWSTA